MINGNPATCFLDYDMQSVVYVAATDTTGTTWGTPGMVCPNYFDANEVCHLAEVDGQPVIAYRKAFDIDDDECSHLYYAIRYE